MTNNNQKLELTWVGKDNPEYDISNIEPRILEEDQKLSNCKNDPNTENMIIHGDNLLALKALLPEYEGKVKCIYIDPPYNTGNAFEHYDDSVEHSTWLSLMKPRLELLKLLLSSDGIIFVQIDDIEQAYLKILMDEVFGRNNFVSMLVIESGEVFGTKAAHLDKTFVKVKDYVLAYFRDNSKRGKFKTLYTKTSEVFDTHYGVYLSDNLEKISLIDFLGNINWVKKLFDKYGYRMSLSNVTKVMELEEEFRSFINLKISKNIFQDQPFSRNLDEETLKQFESKKIININGDYLFKTSSGSIRYYQSFFEAIHETSDYNSEVCRSTARGDLWKNYHIDMRNVDGEGGVKFKSSKKPERLIKDILNVYTNTSDLVLDSFLGSGTTAAVAHKMQRKYIGIEMGDHAYTHCKVRLDNVINGIDQTGISKAVDWKGGGAYKFYELAPSFITKDEFGNPVIDGFYNDAKLIKAMCKLMNFTYQPSLTEYWKHGLGQGKNYLYVTTQLLTVGMIQQIVAHLGSGESLIICPKKYEPGAEKVDNRVTIKKIPQSVLKACHFGKKEYLLPIKENSMEEIEVEEDNE